MVLEGLAVDEGLIWAGDTGWTDYTFSTRTQILPDSLNLESAFIVRYRDSANFYWAGLGCWGHRVSISRVVNGVYEELVFAGSAAELITDRLYDIQIVAVGNQLQLFVDGTLELEVADSSHPQGAIGIRHYNSHVQIQYVDAVAPTTRPTLEVRSTPVIGVPFTITKIVSTGTLTVDTYAEVAENLVTPVTGAIYVNGTYVGDGHYSAVLPVGGYTVSFGPVSGYAAPSAQAVTVIQNLETNVVGTYVLPTNMLLNPSVEDGVGAPDNWYSYVTPAMIAAVSWIADAHSGSKAVRINATYDPAASVNESALWRQLVNVSVGKKYRFRAWYKSSVEARLILISAGAYFNVQLLLPPSASWVQSEWLEITVPSGTTELWADARLFNTATGWAIFDDFELIEVV